ncbi:MAG TPA: sigma 54-interacting transcriptional regulator [Burkholderiales bacterium]
MSHADILLVEDDADLLKLIALRLRSAGYAVRTATSGERALTEMEAARPDVLVTDLKMDGMDGMQLFDAVQRHSPVLPVIILTAHGTIPDAVSATRRGVFGFLPKPFEPRTLLAQIEEALAATRGARSGATLDEDRAWRADIVSQNPKMEEILSQARLVAASDAAVIIRGASGTGKELLARAIHKASSRRRGPFVPVNCAAIPENLLESELFGYRKGAFTGALRDQNGLMQSASGGTLMLDEIGDMPVAVQAKLLRVLAEGEVRPVGATQAVPVDVRIISATHRDLEQCIRDGSFREDLYYRLNVVTLALPTLAERREDIPALATHCLQEVAKRYDKPVHAFAPEALELLVQAPWPGNVRQLANAVERAVALATSNPLPAALVASALGETASEIASLEDARRRFERDYLVGILRLTEGSVTQAARLAQRNRTDFYKLLGRHRIEPGTFKRERRVG